MGDIRKQRTAADKLKIALSAIKGDKTLAEISSMYGVHSRQVSEWKKQFIDGAPSIFGAKRTQLEASETRISQLYEEIGRLKVELDWLKKKAAKFDRN